MISMQCLTPQISDNLHFFYEDIHLEVLSNFYTQTCIRHLEMGRKVQAGYTDTLLPSIFLIVVTLSSSLIGYSWECFDLSGRTNMMYEENSQVQIMIIELVWQWHTLLLFSFNKHNLTFNLCCRQWICKLLWPQDMQLGMKSIERLSVNWGKKHTSLNRKHTHFI